MTEQPDEVEAAETEAAAEGSAYNATVVTEEND